MYSRYSSIKCKVFSELHLSFADFCLIICYQDTESMRGIFLDMADVTKGIVLDRHTFINMLNLRYLKIYDSCCPRQCKAVNNLYFPDGLEFSFKKVRYLHWVKFPLEELPPDFIPSNLVDLRLPYSKIERIWQGVKVCLRLQYFFIRWLK